MGATGGRDRSGPKRSAAKKNGRLGGRLKKRVRAAEGRSRFARFRGLNIEARASRHSFRFRSTVGENKGY
jgi:hypothetical protein